MPSSDPRHLEEVLDNLPHEDNLSQLLEDIAEKTYPPRTRSPSFYLILLFAVIPVWSAIPLSWAFVIYALRSGQIWSFTWTGRLSFAVALCEVFFSVYHYHLVKHISALPPSCHGDLTELQATMKRVLLVDLAFPQEGGPDEEENNQKERPAEAATALDKDDPRAIDFRNSIRTWFRSVPFSSIRRHEVYTWLYWLIFNAHFMSFEDTPLPRQKVLGYVLHLVEQRAGVSIPEGSNPASTPLLLTLDPMSVAWRPLIWYIVISISNYVLRRRFQFDCNAKIDTYNGLEYILRIPRSWSPQTGPRPIVFLHGLGLGLTQYNIFMRYLMKAAPEHPVLIPLYPQVSQEIFHPQFLVPVGRHEAANTLGALLQKLGWVEQEDDESGDPTQEGEASEIPTGVTMISHSNGSFTHGWMLKEHPEMITRSCFLDPVTFCSWEGDLCYNFVYRPCSTGLELLMKYFVGMELGVANVLQRHFDWGSNSLWCEEIPNVRDPFKAVFFVGGRDDIIDAERVRQYLTSHGIRKGLKYYPEGRHGAALLTGGEGRAELLRWLHEPHDNIL